MIYFILESQSEDKKLVTFGQRNAAVSTDFLCRLVTVVTNILQFYCRVFGLFS